MRVSIHSVVSKFLKTLTGTAQVEPDLLNQIVLRWNSVDQLTVRDLLNGGICITGRSGSGKTSSSGRALAEAIIQHHNSGGLILAAKPEDSAMWRAIFERAGRGGDLLVFSPEGGLRFNFLEYAMSFGGQTRDVTRCMTMIGETIRSRDGGGGDEAAFWEREQERMIFNTVEIIRRAKGAITAPAIQQFIGSAPLSPPEIASQDWQSGFCNQCIRDAYHTEKTAAETHDFHMAADYWLSEFPTMAEKTRSCIITGVMGLLHVFNSGVVRELISTTTNTSPEAMLAGKWILCDAAPCEWGDSGRLLAAGWKYLTQRRMLRRQAKHGDAINVIWADEYHQFVNSYDSHYVAQCRSHLGCMVVLSQSLSSYYAALKGESGRHEADALLPNFSTKIFHALGDAKTAEWASDLIGKRIETFHGISFSPADCLWDEICGRSKFSMTTSEHYEPELQPNVFLNGLRTGGQSNGFICDAFVIRSGEPFANGANWLKVEFLQT